MFFVVLINIYEIDAGVFGRLRRQADFSASGTILEFAGGSLPRLNYNRYSDSGFYSNSGKKFIQIFYKIFILVQYSPYNNGYFG